MKSIVLLCLNVFVVFYSWAGFSTLRQDNISTSSFSVSFTTTQFGQGLLFYGTNTNTNNLITGAFSTVNHNFIIDDLSPATLYYVKGACIVGPGDTIFSEIFPMLTASLSSGDIKVYFNRPVDVSYSNGLDAIHLNQTFPDTIKAYIARAQNTLDIAAYSIDNINGIVDAINAAYDRGVTVRFIGNFDINETAFDLIDIGEDNKIKSPTGSVPGGGFYGNMHNKFIIVDAHSSDPNASYVVTGSTNFTNGQLKTDPNDLIIFQDQSLAKAYTIEFEEMFGNTFGPLKTVRTPTQFNIGGRKVEAYFSPKNRVENILINNINNSDHDLYFGVFSYTRDTISKVIANAVDRGVFAAGILGPY
jgi:hypothetical protein